MHQPTNGKQALSLFRFCSRHKTDTNISKNTKATVTGLKKKGSLCVRLHMSFKYEVELLGRNSQIWTWHHRKTTDDRILLCHVWKPCFGDISWWVANWALSLISIFSYSLQLNVSPQIFALIENDDFLTWFTFENWCFWVFAHISSRSSRSRLILIGERFFQNFRSLEIIGDMYQYTETFCHYPETFCHYPWYSPQAKKSSSKIWEKKLSDKNYPFKHVLFFIYTFCFAHAVLCQG